MKNDFLLGISIFSFVLAIFLSSFFKIGITFSIFLIFLSGILLVYRKFIASDSESKKIIFFTAIFALSFALGIFRYEIADSKPLDNNLENNIGEKVVLDGVISDEPKTKSNQVLTVDFRYLISSSSTLAVYGRGIVSTDVYPQFQYGDLIKISGKLEKPENFNNSFDYVSYLGKDNIFYKIDFAKTEFISGGHGNVVKNILFKIKNAFIGNLNQTISEPESSLLSGILLGAKSSIDDETAESFRISGLSHVVALSGYNITIVADAIMRTLSFLPNIFGFIGGIIGIILFVLMSGATSTAVRAGIMALIVILAQVTRRNYQAGRALIIAGFLMVFVNPKILVFDISFQLSFLATTAIIYVAPIIKGKFKFISEKFGLRDTISSTVSAQMLVLPLILHKIGMLSLVAIPANILILVVIPTVMFFSFITGILGFIWIPLSLLFAWISWFLLAYIIRISNFFASLPFAYVNINWFSSSAMIFTYILIFIWLIHEKINEHVICVGRDDYTK